MILYAIHWYIFLQIMRVFRSKFLSTETDEYKSLYRYATKRAESRPRQNKKRPRSTAALSADIAAMMTEFRRKSRFLPVHNILMPLYALGFSKLVNAVNIFCRQKYVQSISDSKTCSSLTIILLSDGPSYVVGILWNTSICINLYLWLSVLTCS